MAAGRCCEPLTETKVSYSHAHKLVSSPGLMPCGEPGLPSARSDHLLSDEEKQ